MNKLTKQLLLLFVVFIVVAALLSNIANPFQTQRIKAGTFSDLVSSIEQQNVNTIRLYPGGRIEADLKDGSLLETQNISGDSLVSTLQAYGIKPETLKEITIQAEGESGFDRFLSLFLPIIIPFLLLGGLLFFLYKQAQGLSNKTFTFGSQAGKQVNLDKAKENKAEQITFKDIAGLQEAKDELNEVIDFLKTPKKFTSLGARIPRGVLLVGPPGCGKTLLAKAVAGEAEVPFFHISGSEFMEMFVGVGASRVRGLFQKAKRSAPSIIFIDELDSIGRKRGLGFGGAHDERDQTLNQILVEMDGFETDTNVIIMAATNRPDVLDPALMRPGRFDRRVAIELPDIVDREKILETHARGKPLAPDVNLRMIAERTPGFSGADLQNVMNEAAILTARKNKKKLTMDELAPSVEKVLLGPERKSRVLQDEEKKITAYHEAGHALVAHALPLADPVHKISIISRGQAGGYTLKVPEKDKHLHSRQEFFDDLAVSMGGLAAEKLVFKEMTTGARSDLQHASRLARRLVMHYGMSDEIGPVSYDSEDLNGFTGYPWEETRNQYSETTLELIDKEVAQILKNAYNTAVEQIEKQRDKLDLIAKELLEKEIIEKATFEKMMADNPQ